MSITVPVPKGTNSLKCQANRSRQVDNAYNLTKFTRYVALSKLFFSNRKAALKLFSALEVARSNEVFSKIENILSKNDYKVEGRYVSIGECDCSSHRQIRFIIELNAKEISIEIIHEIEDALEVLKDVEFANIVTRHQKHSYLDLVFIQVINK